jgi:DNA polymerase alpha subunit A
MLRPPAPLLLSDVCIWLPPSSCSLSECLRFLLLQVKKEVNALYNKLEIEIDGVFKTMLLLKKKKYAALMIHENKNGEVTLEREAKGLDMVRRDWSAISHDVGYYILNQILSRATREDLVEACHE